MRLSSPWKAFTGPFQPINTRRGSPPRFDFIILHTHGLGDHRYLATHAHEATVRCTDTPRPFLFSTGHHPTPHTDARVRPIRRCTAVHEPAATRSSKLPKIASHWVAVTTTQGSRYLSFPFADSVCTWLLCQCAVHVRLLYHFIMDVPVTAASLQNSLNPTYVYQSRFASEPPLGWPSGY